MLYLSSLRRATRLRRAYCSHPADAHLDAGIVLLQAVKVVHVRGPGGGSLALQLGQVPSRSKKRESNGAAKTLETQSVMRFFCRSRSSHGYVPPFPVPGARRNGADPRMLCGRKHVWVRRMTGASQVAGRPCGRGFPFGKMARSRSLADPATRRTCPVGMAVLAEACSACACRGAELVLPCLSRCLRT